VDELADMSSAMAEEAEDTNNNGRQNNIPDDLVVTQDELNGFIGHSDYLRGNMMVTIHKNRIEEELSLPMDVLGFQGRYFVANDYVSLLPTPNKHSGTIQMNVETAATHKDWFDGPLLFARLNYFISKTNSHEQVLELYLREGRFFGLTKPKYVKDQDIVAEFLYELKKGRCEVGDDCFEEELDYLWDIIGNIDTVSVEEGKIVVKARKSSSAVVPSP
jgi:hypothetical protein